MNEKSEPTMGGAGHPWLCLSAKAFSPQKAERSQIRVHLEDSKAGDETVWGFCLPPLRTLLLLQAKLRKGNFLLSRIPFLHK